MMPSGNPQAVLSSVLSLGDTHCLAIPGNTQALISSALLSALTRQFRALSPVAHFNVDEKIEGSLLPWAPRAAWLTRSALCSKWVAGASRVEVPSTVPGAGEAPQCANGRFEPCKYARFSAVTSALKIACASRERACREARSCSAIIH